MIKPMKLFIFHADSIFLQVSRDPPAKRVCKGKNAEGVDETSTGVAADVNQADEETVLYSANAIKKTVQNVEMTLKKSLYELMNILEIVQLSYSQSKLQDNVEEL